MSLYDQFFSDINKDFMFKMADNVLKKDFNITIEGDEKIKKTYLQDMEDIFENNDCEDISEINKILLDTTIKKNKGTTIEEENNEEKSLPSGFRKEKDKSGDTEKRLNELMKERESIQQPQRSDGQIKTETSISDILKNDMGTRIESIIDDYDSDDSVILNERKVVPLLNEINLKLCSFTSNKRTSINTSRYNYSIDLLKEGIDSQKLHSLSRIIIPIEENYIFTLPIFKLKIKELDIDVCMQQKEIITNDFGSVGIYEPIENIIFNITVPLRRLSIDIRDISNVKYSTNDILKINIMEIKKNVIIFTCSKIDTRNFKVKDMIKIINIQTFDLYIIELLSNPLKIKAIKDNMIFCKVDGEHSDKIYNNIDMKILNISNQNMIYFNQYS